MTAWQQLPDFMRGTGRTSRMLDAVTEASLAATDDEMIYVVIGMNKHESLIKDQLRELGADMKKIRIFTQKTPPSLSGSWIKENVFWDHYAVDLREEAEINKILNQTKKLRRWG